MSVPLQVTFRDMEPSEFIESTIREKAEKLGQFGKINHCRVTIERPHKHQHSGALYDVHIDIRVPGAELVVNHQGTGDSSHEDVYVAIRDAFRAARRTLLTHNEKQREHIKRPTAQA